jgi:hypothetical protein
LGPEHPGYFPVGDDAALAALLLRAEEEPRFLEHLHAFGAERATLFTPAREREALRRIVSRL